jgi:SRSO17 transposase
LKKSIKSAGFEPAQGGQPMEYQNARQDIRLILSWFSDAFSRPSFRIFSSFIVGFIQLGKEAHTASMVQSLSRSSLFRSLSSFTRFLGKNAWAKEQLVEIALRRFFDTLRIKAHCVVFLIIDDTIAQKSGKKIPGCSWHKDHAHNMANVFGHQWVISALLYKEFLLPLWARLYHGKATKGCGCFRTKIAIAQKMVRDLKAPVSCKLYVIADSWYWAKELVKVCRSRGYHMISQLKSNSVILLNGKRTRVTQLEANLSAYREICLPLYGKNKTIKVAKFIGGIKDLGKVAVVVVKEKRKKAHYLISTSIHLSAIDVVKYYARRWKIEQMIKDLKQRLGFRDYQTRNLQAINRHVALALLCYFTLIVLKILQWHRDKTACLNLSIRLLAFHVRRYILVEHITVTMKTMKIRFKQNILDTYLEQICV